MKAWIVRFVSLYVFNVVVLLLIGLLLPTVQVGWAALWASVVLTAGTIWLKPVITRFFGRATAGAPRTGVVERVVRYGTVFAVELVIWIAVVLLSGVDVRGWFWGYLLPPLFLLVAWIIYDTVDDAIATRAGAIYDRATAGRGSSAPSAPVTPSAATREGQAELRDGLTAEQRKLFNDLDK